jgi:hypothetical protein
LSKRREQQQTGEGAWLEPLQKPVALSLAPALSRREREARQTRLVLHRK